MFRTQWAAVMIQCLVSNTPPHLWAKWKSFHCRRDTWKKNEIIQLHTFFEFFLLVFKITLDLQTFCKANHGFLTKTWHNVIAISFLAVSTKAVLQQLATCLLFNSQFNLFLHFSKFSLYIRLRCPIVFDREQSSRGPRNYFYGEGRRGKK